MKNTLTSSAVAHIIVTFADTFVAQLQPTELAAHVNGFRKSASLRKSLKTITIENAIAQGANKKTAEYIAKQVSEHVEVQLAAIAKVGIGDRPGMTATDVQLAGELQKTIDATATKLAPNKAKNARFAKGSGCYTCKGCGKKTRSTGRGDNEHLGQCVNCYEMAGDANAVLDRQMTLEAFIAQYGIDNAVSSGLCSREEATPTAIAISNSDQGNEQDNGPADIDTPPVSETIAVEVKKPAMPATGEIVVELATPAMLNVTRDGILIATINSCDGGWRVFPKVARQRPSDKAWQAPSIAAEKFYRCVLKGDALKAIVESAKAVAA